MLQYLLKESSNEIGFSFASIEGIILVLLIQVLFSDK